MLLLLVLGPVGASRVWWTHSPCLTQKVRAGIGSSSSAAVCQTAVRHNPAASKSMYGGTVVCLQQGLLRVTASTCVHVLVLVQSAGEGGGSCAHYCCCCCRPLPKKHQQVLRRAVCCCLERPATSTTTRPPLHQRAPRQLPSRSWGPLWWHMGADWWQHQHQRSEEVFFLGGVGENSMSGVGGLVLSVASLRRCLCAPSPLPPSSPCVSCPLPPHTQHNQAPSPHPLPPSFCLHKLGEKTPSAASPLPCCCTHTDGLCVCGCAAA